jgi:hypothetical protein
MSATIFDPRSAKTLNGAVSQFDRVRAAPAPARVRVDGRSLAQLLAFGARYGALIRFYDLADMENGDWSAFFAADPSVALAAQAALDLPEIERALRLTLTKARAARHHDERHPHEHRAKRVIVRLLFVLDASFDGGRDGEDVDVQLTVRATIERRDGIGHPLREWHRHHRHRPSHDDRDWHHRHIDLLEDLIAALIAELERCAANALEALEATLESRGHAPQAALWNAFVMLFDEARTEMNRFPQRLLNFYYDDILKQRSRPARPDEVFLAFTLAQGATEASVAKGSLFVAGTDAQGDPVYYAATSSLEVEAASVTAFGVHRVIYAGDADGDGDDAQPTGVLSGTISLPATGGADIEPFPLFGGPGRGTYGSLKMAPASLGFIIESATLLMTGGDRTVRIALAPSRSDPAVQPATLTPMNSAAPVPVMATGSPAAPADIPASAFRLVYSTAGGWTQVSDLSVTVAPDGDGGPQSVILSFRLPPDAPPLVPVSTKAAPGAPTPTLPATAYPDLTGQATIVATLLPETEAAAGAAGDAPVAVSTYALLSTMCVSSIAVDVAVDQFVPPVLSSPNGPIDPSQNFAIFGLAPTQNAALEFSAPEFFVKPVTRLSATIGWAGLPVTSTGFQGYYKAYLLNADGVPSTDTLFDNTTFRAAFSVVSPGPWTLDSTSQLYLFQTEGSSTAAGGPPPDPATTVLPTSLLTAPGVIPHTPPPYYNPASSTLCLSLVEPDYAFGNILYASNLMAASTANAAAMRTSAASASSARTQLAIASSINATATSKKYGDRVGDAVGRAVSALNGQAYATLQHVVTNDAAADTLPSDAWQSLKATIEDRLGGSSLWSWLKTKIAPAGEGAVTAALRDWMAAHEGDLAQAARAAWAQADAALTAAETLAAEWKKAAGKTVAAARPSVAAALDHLLVGSGGPPSTTTSSPDVTLPNQPWLPTASSFTISYAAASRIALTPLAPAAPAALFSLSDTVPRHAAARGGRFLHLGPFDNVMPVATPAPGTAAPHIELLAVGSAPGVDAPLLPRINGRAAFYIDLSAPVAQISLLFALTAGPDGWSSGPSTLTWQKKVGDRWKTITAVGDSTNGLRNSGIITLQVATSQHGDTDTAQSLRAILDEGDDNSAYVLSITTNALTATWSGPGGAATLGQPLPAGTIKQSKTTIAGIGSIAQPMQSIGGAPPSAGAPFQMWMAERLRHKGFAIQAWDYARLVLDAIPSLWQLAVVPATDEATGRSAPGHVWLIAVAGPQMPNISDPTIPTVDPGILGEIGELLAGITSPFAQLTVTNPPYLRLKVHATLVFSDADTPAFWIDQLKAELTKWLSPWPDATIGPRPADYYTRQSIAEFIRQRSYVLGITSLHVIPEKDPTRGGWHYLTSSLHHDLISYTPPATSEHRRRGRPRHLTETA